VSAIPPKKSITIVRRRWWFLAFALIALALLIGGYRYYRAESKELYRDKQQAITAIAELKSEQIQEFRKNLLINTERIKRSPLVRKAVEEAIRNPDNKDVRDTLKERLKLERELGVCSNAWLLDLDGNTLLSTSGVPYPSSPKRQVVIRDASKGGSPTLSDLFRYADGSIHLDAISPINNALGQPQAIVVLRVDAKSELYPILDSWPTLSRSAETLLVERDGENALFLNDGRHRAGGALSMREPLTQTYLPAVQAVLGKYGAFDGIDYRGMNVLTDLRPIPGSPWFMVNKIDADEFMEDARNQALTVALTVAFLIALTALVFSYSYWRLRTDLTRKLYESERQEKEALEQKVEVDRHLAHTSQILDHASRLASVVGWELDTATNTLQWTNNAHLLFDDGADIPIDLSQGLDLSLPEVRPILQKAVESALREGSPFDVEIKGATKGDQPRWLRILGVPHSEDGKVVRLSGAAQDITQRKMAEERILRLNQLYEALSRCNRAIVHCTDKAALFQEICHIAVECGGMKMAWVGLRDEESGKIKPACGYGDGADCLDDNWISADADDPLGRGPTGTAIRTGKPVWCQDLKQDPTTLPWHGFAERFGWVSDASLPLFTGGKTVGAFALYSDKIGAFDGEARDLLLEMASDISFALDNFVLRDRHSESEGKLRQLSLAVEQNPATIVITDTTGKIEYVNQKFVELTGYTKEEAIGNNPRVLKSGEKRSEEYRELWETITSGQIWRGEFHNKKKNGELYWENALIAPIRNPAGEITHFLAVKEDITGRKEMEVDLIHAKEHAVAANLAKSEFLANVSHELRTPLNAIIGMSEMLECAPTGPEAAEYIRTIRNSGDALLSLISGILDLSKIEAGKLVLERIPIDLKACMESTLKTFIVEAAAKDLVLTSSIDPSLPAFILGDRNRLCQIVLNLVSNAVKFTATGEIHIAAKRVSRPGEGDFFHLSVKDTGIGIAAEDIEKLFHPFSQVDASTTRRFGGSGLGLAVAHRLVELMGGRIWVQSHPGKGSDFQFEIPLIPANTAQSAPIPTHSSIPDESLAMRCPLRILVAEDNQINQRVIGLVLGRLGYSPAFAENGSTALAALDREPYDLILMDIQMPVMDGLQAAAEVCRRYTGQRRPQMIAVTAHALQEDRARCIDAGMDDYLSKPLRIDQLAAALEAAHGRLSEQSQ